MMQCGGQAEPHNQLLTSDAACKENNASRRPSLNKSLKIDIPLESEHIAQDFCPDRVSLLLRPQERRVSCFTHLLEPTFHESFSFMFVSGPDYGFSSSKGLEFLRKLDTKISLMKPVPKFLALCGGLATHIKNLPAGSLVETIDNGLLKSAVKVVCVPNADDLARIHSRYDEWGETMRVYRELFGDECFSFWINGVSFLVVDSAMSNKDIVNCQFAQERSEWLSSELLQNSIIKPKHIIILSDTLAVLEQGRTAGCGELIDTSTHVCQLLKDTTLHVFCSEIQGLGQYPRVVATPKVEDGAEFVRLVRIQEQEVTSELLSVDDVS